MTEISNDTSTQQKPPKRKNNGTHLKTVKRQQMDARIQEEVRLRRLGYSYREIGEQLGVDHTVVFDDVKKVMEETIRETKEDCEHIRQMELERIDSILPAVIDQAKTGDTKAIDSVVKLMDRRAKYLGLDAAQKQEQAGIVTVYLRESQNEEL